MISDEQLRVALRGEAASHEPDLTHLRARFEAGRGAVAAGQDVSAGRTGRDFSGRRSDRLRSGVRPGHRFSGMMRPAVLVAAVVCAVTALTHTQTLTSLLNHGSGKSVTAGQVASGTKSAPTAAPTSSPAGVPASATPKDNAGTSTRPTSKIGAPVTAHSPAGTGKSSETTECSLGKGIVLSPYWLTDNLWAADKGTGTQCVKALSGAGHTVRWSSTWNWSGGPGQVKSFASVVLGWHWGWSVSDSGLPVQVSTLNSVPTTWNYTVEQTTPNQLDVAYDLWFHTIPNPTSQTPSAEVRIVINRIGLADLGTDGWAGRYSIDGASWDLYKSTNGWGVYTFVRAQPATSVKLDLKRYIDVAQVVGTPGTFGYLSSVQAGADVLNGAGRLTTSSYSVRIH